MRFIKLRCFRSCSWYLWKKLWQGGRGAWAWFHNVWTCGVRVLELLHEFFLTEYIKINHNWKFQRNWDVPFGWCCWKDLEEQDLMEYVLEDLDLGWGRYWVFKWFFYHWKFKLITKRSGFGTEKSVENVNYHTWRSTIQFKYEELGCAICILLQRSPILQDLMKFIL